MREPGAGPFAGGSSLAPLPLVAPGAPGPPASAEGRGNRFLGSRLVDSER